MYDQLPDWRPDGTQIAYEEGDPGRSRIFVMDADGRHPRLLSVDPGDDFGPA
jgi:Tol biopolymer transport system component